MMSRDPPDSGYTLTQQSPDPEVFEFLEMKFLETNFT